MRRGIGVAGLIALLSASVASGQGPLTPPGAPAPTMKTLDQVEARKPIPGGTSPFTISTSGSYYLTGNITVASGDVITINASNVTLDLNGYTIATTSATPLGTAIVITTGVSARDGVQRFHFRFGHHRLGETTAAVDFTTGSHWIPVLPQPIRWWRAT